MKQQQKANIFFFSIIGCYIALAVLEIVTNQTYDLLKWFGVMVGLLVIGFLLSRWTGDFKKIVDSLPADHKLVTDFVTVIDIGNFRFLYHVYGKGSGMSPVSKSYISLEVGIPFPEEETDKDEYTVRDSIRRDLQNLMDTLDAEGILTGHNPILREISWPGQPFRLEFLLKSVAPSKMVDIQGKIVGIIDKYRLQDVSWCVIHGSEYGSEYRFHKGNTLQSTVLIRDTFNYIHSDYKAFASMLTGEFNHPFSVKGYLELYEMSSRDLGKGDLHIGDVKKLVKQLFKGKKNREIRISASSDVLSVDVSIPGQMVASTYYLMHTEDLWWVYAVGRLSNINPISTDEESTACDLLLRILRGIAESE